LITIAFETFSKIDQSHKSRLLVHKKISACKVFINKAIRMEGFDALPCAVDQFPGNSSRKRVEFLFRDPTIIEDGDVPPLPELPCER